MCPILNLLNRTLLSTYWTVAGKPIKKTTDKMLLSNRSQFYTINVTGRTDTLLSLPHLISELQFEWQIIMLYINFSWFRGTYRNISRSLDFFLCFPYQRLLIHISFFHFLEWFTDFYKLSILGFFCMNGLLMIYAQFFSVISCSSTPASYSLVASVARREWFLK